MDLKKSKRLIVIMAVIYWIFAIGIYGIAHEQFRYSAVIGEAPSAGYIIGEVVDEAEVSQNVVAPAKLLQGIEIMAGTYGRENSGSITVAVMDETQEVLTEKTVDVAALVDNQYISVSFDAPVEVTAGQPLVIRLTTQGCSEGNAITLYAGSHLNGQEVTEGYQIDGTEMVGALCVRLFGRQQLTFYKTYWLIIAGAFAVLCVCVARWWKAAKQGKSNPLVSLLTVYSRYGFLIKQLVSRDFKTKYKRSSLGMAWSFMNPLLTMMVQYLVFSTLFKSDVPNYPVYLLTGIVCFNFFNEAVSLGMTAITSNASLIKKVYMPKYIYPVSRILSSLVNFGFALLPLLIVMIVTGTPFRPAIFLVVFDILCMLCFIMGMTLLLATCMTFFQDTQFLWNVISMLWQYLTPIFYPETIIPDNLLPIYRLNPMYQYIKFARICIVDGVSPAPDAYFGCVISAAAVLLLGIYVFKKQQNKFVLYL